MKANDLKNAIAALFEGQKALFEGQKALTQSTNTIAHYLDAMYKAPTAVAVAPTAVAVAPTAVAVAPTAVALTPAQKAKLTRERKKAAALALSVEPLASSQMTFKLWIANKAANKVNPAIEVVKDYHKRNLTVSQAQFLLDGFNAITGYKG